MKLAVVERQRALIICSAPDYIPGKVAVLVLLSAQILISLFLRWANQRLNRSKAAWIEKEIQEKQWTDDDIRRERERHAFLDMTDKQYVVLLSD